MALSSTTTKVSYNGDGATTSFAVTFIFWNNSDLRVIHRDSAGTETVWSEGTQYTLSGGSGATGTLTVKTTPTDYTPASGETLVIKDAQAEVQGDSLPLSGAFPSTVVEQRMDKITRLIQNHSEEIARSILLPETASLSGLTIPEPGASEILRYNAAGDSLETVALADLSLAIDTVLTGLAANDLLKYDGTNWVNLASGATGLALLQDATAADARAELGLGDAALKTVGVADGNVPVMDATGYPAADGSQITNLNIPLPRGYIDGLILSNNGAVAIDLAGGAARDGGDVANMVLAAALTNKQLNAAWAVGSAAGMLDTGAIAANAWYHVWLIQRSDTGVVDVLASLSATAPTMPASYDRKRRIGAVLTDGAPNILAFRQTGDDFFFDTHAGDYTASNPGTAAILVTLTVPTGVKVRAHFALKVGETSATARTYYVAVTDPDQADVAPSANRFDVAVEKGGTDVYASGNPQVTTNTSAQIRYRLSASSAGTDVWISTHGWKDPRGRNA